MGFERANEHGKTRHKAYRGGKAVDVSCRNHGELRCLMNSVMIKMESFKEWLVDYITDTIHGMKAEDSPEFDKWAVSFKREEAEFVVNMEFDDERGDETTEDISEDEARKYAEPLLKMILDRWYL